MTEMDMPYINFVVCAKKKVRKVIKIEPIFIFIFIVFELFVLVKKKEF